MSDWGVEREVSNPSDQTAALEAEKMHLLAQSSSSHTSAYPDVRRELYEK